MTTRRLPSAKGDDGTAVVEFVLLAVLLMVPLAYVVLTVFEVQRAAYAATAATREAGRAYTTAADSADADERARTAAAIALADHGLELDPGQLTITCANGQGCLSAGARVRVHLDTEVPLPLLPRVLAGRAPASIDIQSTHVEIVDEFRGSRS
jgi:Flp pilus assembly protein TadG